MGKFKATPPIESSKVTGETLDLVSTASLPSCLKIKPDNMKEAVRDDSFPTCVASWTPLSKQEVHDETFYWIKLN